MAEKQEGNVYDFVAYGITLVIIIIIILFVYDWFHPSVIQTSRFEKIDGASYSVNYTVYAFGNGGCISIQSAQYYVANQTGVHYYTLNSSGLDSIAQYLNCEYK